MSPSTRPGTATRELGHALRAMATDVTLRVIDPRPGAASALERARSVFADVESACTRFDPNSPLMLANAAPDRWHEVPGCCARAVREAARAHRATGGLFDPRVLSVLTRLGYDRTLSFPDGTSTTVAAAAPMPDDLESFRPRWRPRTDHRAGRHRIHLDGAAIDLGGIGKGLAVRWAWQALRGSGGAAMVDAGGDCRFSGAGPDGTGWSVGVEDPRGAEAPLAVLSLTDTGCATSSVRIRRWRVDGRVVHHLIDPRTGASGGAGLLAVTVVHPDPAWAEVWSKSLFLSGGGAVAEAAAARRLAALWVTEDGTLHLTDAARALVVWTSTDGYV